MKTIRLTQGYDTVVDDEDYEWLFGIKWHVDKGYSNYARGYVNGNPVRMHRLILGLTDPKIQADHVNRDTLDNQRKNLRVANPSQNSSNQGIRSDNLSGYTGVYKRKGRSLWEAEVWKTGKKYHLGSFDNIVEAALAYDKAVVELHGAFATTNF